MSDREFGDVAVKQCVTPHVGVIDAHAEGSRDERGFPVGSFHLELDLEEARDILSPYLAGQVIDQDNGDRASAVEYFADPVEQPQPVVDLGSTERRRTHLNR